MQGHLMCARRVSTPPMDIADRVISVVVLVFAAACVCALLAHVLFV